MKNLLIGIMALISITAFARVITIENPNVNGAYILASSNSDAVCQIVSRSRGADFGFNKHSEKLEFEKKTEVVKVSMEFFGYQAQMKSKHVDSAKIIKSISCDVY